MKALDTTKARSAKSAPKPKGPQPPALIIEPVEVDADCVGSRWTAADIDHLARIIAIIAMGQAAHAARIIAELLPSEPAIHYAALQADARQRLSIVGRKKEQRETSRYRRDGLIFEAISWAAAHQATAGKALLRDPHLSSTTQGLDGLMIELDEAGTAVARATIFEDKCSEHPRHMFRYEILPAFRVYHDNKRASELVATAAALIEKIGIDGTRSTIAAARVLDKNYRAYRGSLAVTTADDSLERRKKLFKNYGELKDMQAAQRIGAVLITSDDLRAWFDQLAGRAIAYIDHLEPEDA
jgi:hypothetical protein